MADHQVSCQQAVLKSAFSSLCLQHVLLFPLPRRANQQLCSDAFGPAQMYAACRLMFHKPLRSALHVTCTVVLATLAQLVSFDKTLPLLTSSCLAALAAATLRQPPTSSSAMGCWTPGAPAAYCKTYRTAWWLSSSQREPTTWT